MAVSTGTRTVQVLNERGHGYKLEREDKPGQAATVRIEATTIMPRRVPLAELAAGLEELLR